MKQSQAEFRKHTQNSQEGSNPTVNQHALQKSLTIRASIFGAMASPTKSISTQSIHLDLGSFLQGSSNCFFMSAESKNVDCIKLQRSLLELSGRERQQNPSATSPVSCPLNHSVTNLGFPSTHAERLQRGVLLDGVSHGHTRRVSNLSGNKKSNRTVISSGMIQSDNCKKSLNLHIPAKLAGAPIKLLNTRSKQDHVPKLIQECIL